MSPKDHGLISGLLVGEGFTSYQLGHPVLCGLFLVLSLLVYLRPEWGSDPIQDYRTKVEDLVRKIHQTLKRGERTQDHGLVGNLECILDHVSPESPDILDVE